jgi:serine/threonine-protein kinase
MAESLGRALQAIHAAGLVHRNVAPANVMIRPDGTVALGGLLYSKALDPSASTSFQYNGPGSPAGMLAALPLYPAPEMFEGQPADPRSDIFAVGCVLHRCLAGADAPLEVIRDSSAPEPSISSDLKRAVRERPAGEPGLDASSSDALVLLIERCLRRSPANRYESADELIRAVTSAHPRPPALTSGALRLALLAAAVLLVGLGSYLAFTQ